MSLRQVKELSFYVKWQGLDWKVDAWQPWQNLKGTCDDALTTLATRFGLPMDLFHKGSHRLPLHIPVRPVMPPQAILNSAHAQPSVH